MEMLGEIINGLPRLSVTSELLEVSNSLAGRGKQSATSQNLMNLYANDQFIFLMPDLDIEAQKPSFSG